VFVIVLTTLFLTAGVAQAATLTCGTWSVVKSPNVGGSRPSLGAVAAVSKSDVWAVGLHYSNNGSFPSRTLIEHWNGTSWSIVPSPNPGKFSQLYKLAAVSANDIWAVGRFNTGNSILQTLIEHWNGTSWSVVKSPSPGSFDNALVGVAVVSTNDVWAVGGSENG